MRLFDRYKKDNSAVLSFNSSSIHKQMRIIRNVPLLISVGSVLFLVVIGLFYKNEFYKILTAKNNNQSVSQNICASSCTLKPIGPVSGPSGTLSEPSSSEPMASNETVNVSTSATPGISTPAAGDWLGFGVNWLGVPHSTLDSAAAGNADPYNWVTSASGSTGSSYEALQSLDETRILTLHPAYVRLTTATSWFDPTYTPGEYTWDSATMYYVKNALTFLKANNIPVIITFQDGMPANYVYGSSSWNSIQTAFINQLVNVWGYTNITGVINLPEPESDCLDTSCATRQSLAQWESADQQFYSVFTEAGLNTKVSLIGPTFSINAGQRSDLPGWGTDWDSTIADNSISGDFSRFDYHQYPTNTSTSLSDDTTALNKDAQQKIVAQIVNQVHSSTYAKNTPVTLTEFGLNDYYSEGARFINTGQFGLYIMDYATQIVNGGASAASPWLLDDDDPGLNSQGAGMWQPGGNYNLRPWYFSMSLLYNTLPIGSSFYEVSNSNPDVDIMVAKLPGSNQWSVIVVNMSASQTSKLKITVPGMGSSVALHNYRYSASGNYSTSNTDLSQLIDNSMPILYPGGGSVLSLSVPSLSAEVLTTLNF